MLLNRHSEPLSSRLCVWYFIAYGRPMPFGPVCFGVCLKIWVGKYEQKVLYLLMVSLQVIQQCFFIYFHAAEFLLTINHFFEYRAVRRLYRFTDPSTTENTTVAFTVWLIPGLRGSLIISSEATFLSITLHRVRHTLWNLLRLKMVDFISSFLPGFHAPFAIPQWQLPGYLP